jgi:hypothetical protein
MARINSGDESLGPYTPDQQRSAQAMNSAILGNEDGFQRWYAGWARRTGLDPNPDAPEHKYDYRGAYAAGAMPSIDKEDGYYHWPSEFKHDDHPNRFINGMDTKHGVAR